jgi:DNA-binding CsgD family transcriptional regulator
LRTALALDDLQAERDGLNEPLDRLGIAAFVIARDGRVCWMNRAAESMLRAADGITIRHGRVVAMHPRLAPRLDTLLSHVLATAAGTVMGGSAQVLRIARPSGKRDYELSASPLQHSDLGAFVGGTRILLLVRDPDGDVAPNEQLLRELYGLSPQEAVLARCLAEGLTVEEAAARLGTTINTTRVYLRRIFRKTETDRQVDLLRLLLRVLPR